MIKTYKCNCKKDKARVTIDPNNKSMVCGIPGIIDIYDVRIIKGKIICNKCKNVFYTYDEYKGKH